jgi:hypothetical protein
VDEPIYLPDELMWLFPLGAIVVLLIGIYNGLNSKDKIKSAISFAINHPFYSLCMTMGVIGFLVFSFWILSYGKFQFKIFGYQYQWVAFALGFLSFVPKPISK